MAKELTRVELTNLDKILYPDLRISKAQVIEYYIRIAPKMLDILADRPLVMTRYPDGVNAEGFYEKDAPAGTPPWVETLRKHSETAKRDINYVLCNNLDTLIWLANLAALEIHVTLSKADFHDNPDLIMFDLDPVPPAQSEEVVDAALLLREKLEALGLKPYVKTSGKKGLHVILPIVKGYTFRQTRSFVHEIAENLATESPLVLPESYRSKKPGTVAIDYVQNSHAKTMVCPYSLRANSEATVSTPLEWSDIKKGLKPSEFNLFSVPRSDKNPWKELLEERQRLEVKQK
jgi:bifunctional non-homologous end joining protein LigD